MPRLDVFILSYNRAEYIGDTIKSLQAQTFRDFRLIVLDNGSADATREVVGSHEGVEFEPKAVNEGFYPNFMRIKKLARAEWVMAFHDDDLLHPHYLENIFEAIDQTPGCLVAGANYHGRETLSIEELSARPTPHAQEILRRFVAAYAAH